MAYETIIYDKDDGVAKITLNRPQALNALNRQLLAELAEAVVAADADDEVGCLVLTGSDKAFAAGADIKEMAPKGFVDVLMEDMFGPPTAAIARCRKPIIAAVNGYALGGGCELAMLCDTIFAGEGAKFGQPEIKLGVIPGIGGSQRLPRAVGKAKAMDMVLTGRNMDAEEAERAGLVSRIFPAEDLLEETMKVARAIAGLSRPAVLLAKEAVNRAGEGPLAEGLLFERRAFHALFATEDQKEGMAAFIDKRSPKFHNK
ncbi:MAG: enoyl-CoA hydratase [Pseudomonadota bacterium]